MASYCIDTFVKKNLFSPQYYEIKSIVLVSVVATEVFLQKLSWWNSLNNLLLRIWLVFNFMTNQLYRIISHKQKNNQMQIRKLFQLFHNLSMWANELFNFFINTSIVATVNDTKNNHQMSSGNLVASRLFETCTFIIRNR